MTDRGTQKKQQDSKAQSAAFRKAARELGCDDNEERFQDVLRTIAKRKPRPVSKGKNKATETPKSKR